MCIQWIQGTIQIEVSKLRLYETRASDSTSYQAKTTVDRSKVDDKVLGDKVMGKVDDKVLVLFLRDYAEAVRDSRRSGHPP
jgi:hypothetical protein